MDMIRQWMTHPRLRVVVRVLLSPYVANGTMAALGLLLISGLVRLWLGPEAAAAASVGVIVCIPPDQASPKQGKIWLLLPSAILGLPVFAAVQALHASPLYLGLLLVSATFLAFLAGAWGKRGLPIVMSLMFAALFSMAMPRQTSEASVLFNSACFALGAAVYQLWATLANALLNPFYRVAILPETLFSMAALMRLQARQFQPRDESASPSGLPVIGAVLRRQAQLSDQMQAARALGYPVAGHGRRVFAEHGGLVHVALFEAHALAVFQVDGRDQEHGGIGFRRDEEIRDSSAGSCDRARGPGRHSSPDGTGSQRGCRARPPS